VVLRHSLLLQWDTHRRQQQKQQRRRPWLFQLLAALKVRWLLRHWRRALACLLQQRQQQQQAALCPC
jgi:hypothetical protein